MSIINEPDRTKLYQKVRHVLGAPLRSIELEDEQMDTLLEFSIDDYSEFIQNWLIESNWTNLWGLNVETQSLSRAFLTKSLDFETRYTYAYSKIAGLQTGGDWVLKKDYIQIVGHTGMKRIDLEGNDKFTGGRYYFIDTMETSGDYLIIEDNKIRTNSVK